MAKKKKTKKGFTVYFLSKEEQLKLLKNGAFGGICERCFRNISNEDIFYIPVLNYGMCMRCYMEWYNGAVYYIEDEWFAELNSEWLEKQLNKANISIQQF